ncbi:MAG: 4'-phosphopantetheinyl transferase superfamily protein [Bacteroidota bacterium]
MAGVLGCGIDLLETARIDKYFSLNQFNFPCKEQVFTEYELSHLNQEGASSYFPLAFSCKESAFKAFGISWTNSPAQWTDVELNISNANKFDVHLSGYLKDLSLEIGVQNIETAFHYPSEGLLFFKLILFSK